MPATPFIQVILPLKLEWEPYYELEGTAVGDRVDLVFARRHYVGVVSAVSVVPEAGLKVLPAVPSELPPVGVEEIDFWRRLAAYYLCTVGEVYKVAYPMRQVESEKVTTRRTKAPETASEQAALVLSSAQESAVQAILQGFGAGKTVLLEGADEKTDIYVDLAERTLSEGKSVLCLVPEVTLSRQLEARFAACIPGVLRFDSSRTVAARRDVAKAVRSGAPYVVLGTRSALFLPHRNLGLVIVHEEQESAYKQDSPAPRLHAREASILLSLVHHSAVLLGSSTPSLESLYNVERGAFVYVDLKRDFYCETELVNLSAETRKKGLKGSFSLKLLQAVQACLERREKVLLISRYKAAQEESLAELKTFFPSAPDKLLVTATPASFKSLKDSSFGLVAVHQADSLLGKEDFRSDERALQVFRQLQLRTSLLVIQTREPSHPVFKALQEGQDARVFLPERQAVGYPPVTRLVDIGLLDENPKRLAFLSSKLARSIGPCLGPYAPQGREDARILRVTIPRDKSLKGRKQQIVAAVAAFEKEHKYIGHIHLDVDPL